ncbi:MAG: polyprenyl synthetase family protein [Patescibacteria group bacterium]|nr:polyprenyl synthetase family protein [Patescibacteria group bacterium]
MCQKEYLLGELKSKADKELNKFFNSEIKQAKKEEKPKEYLEMLKNLKAFTLNGGKRIRPILFYYGYFIAGGKKEKDIFEASISIELIHSYFLIHDDIIDEDDFRRHNLSMHRVYENESKKRQFRTLDEKARKHFGISMAIIAGDLASSLGCEVLTCSNFLSDLKIKAVKKLNQVVLNTLTGEAMDVVLADCLNVDLEDVFEMQRYKTAKYTFEGPLHLGAILAGADEKFLKSISEFAIPLGIAFQIQDDIIGVFGNKKKTGKPVGADIKEGKKTLLTIKAFEKADGKQLKTLSMLFGNKDISLKEVDNFRELIKKTGSFEYSLEKINELIKFSKARLEKIKISKQNKECLLGLIDLMARRKY